LRPLGIPVAMVEKLSIDVRHVPTHGIGAERGLRRRRTPLVLVHGWPHMHRCFVLDQAGDPVRHEDHPDHRERGARRALGIT
jgi:hypothetical protein